MAVERLGPELLGLTGAVDAEMGSNRRATITDAISQGGEAWEQGDALYDAEQGLMQEVVFDMVITANSIERVLRYHIVRLAS